MIFNEKGSKGFGFVTIDGDEAAKKAKNALDGSIIDGQFFYENFHTKLVRENLELIKFGVNLSSFSKYSE